MPPQVRRLAQPLLQTSLELLRYPESLRRANSVATLRVQLLRGERLLAADAPSLSHLAGTCDPYVILKLGAPDGIRHQPLGRRWAVIRKLADLEASRHELECGHACAHHGAPPLPLLSPQASGHELVHPALSAALKARYNLTRWCFGGEDEISISATELHALNKQLPHPPLITAKSYLRAGELTFRPVPPLMAFDGL